MPASGILVDAVNACKTALTGLGLVPITDPRNARPLSVLIELPTVSAFTYNVGDIELRLRLSNDHRRPNHEQRHSGY